MKLLIIALTALLLASCSTYSNRTYYDNGQVRSETSSKSVLGILNNSLFGGIFGGSCCCDGHHTCWHN